jgi:hypothetical protein
MITCSKQRSIRSVARMKPTGPARSGRPDDRLREIRDRSLGFQRRSRISLRFMRATKNKGGGTPADAYLQPPHPRLNPPALARKNRGGGAARVHADKCAQACAHQIHATRRLSAFHRGTCCSEPTPQLSSGRASWDLVGAHDPDGSKDRALLNGRYPLLPVPVQRAPRRPVIVPAGRCSEAARERR